ncbi:hypothetical protein HDV00_007359 [Rhizophlyctis rosea]|nr:hypothetical protein HDV00_007359 [Rhizophlyctis rosea]
MRVATIAAILSATALSVIAAATPADPASTRHRIPSPSTKHPKPGVLYRFKGDTPGKPTDDAIFVPPTANKTDAALSKRCTTYQRWQCLGYKWLCNYVYPPGYSYCAYTGNGAVVGYVDIYWGYSSGDAKWACQNWLDNNNSHDYGQDETTSVKYISQWCS